MVKINAAKEAAILYRKQGLSLREIVEKVQRPQSTISGWVRDVALTEEQKEYLDSKNPAKKFNPYLNSLSAERTRVVWMERRKKFQEEGRKLCREAIINKDIDFIVGIILYWTEGARSSNRSAVKFCNTDIDMIRIFISFLTKYFSINSSEICLQIYCWLNSEISLDAIESYWVTNLNLKKENLRKAYIEQKRKVTGKRKNVHLYGVCNIAINRTDIIQKIYGAIQEFTGVEKPKWLL